ncbi:MAG: lipopolysaccharide transport periplasmic protein LptA [Acetobacteraceae bacterium]|nr:lipopolysaccharide transport periplasmic protein LptA [Acetobacteraceae bacterium]
MSAMLAGLTPLAAQQPSGPPNALQGFSQNRDKPINIKSATLEVRDKEKVATFAGDVHLVQGDTTLRSNILVVFYENEQAGAAAKSPGAGAGGPSSSQIRWAEAKGDVIVVQKDQTATGDNGVFDMRANTVTLMGNVVISQGANVVKGDRLTVDMTTGVSHVECGKTANGCRVQALFQPNAVKAEPRPAETPPTRDTPRQRAPKP